MTRRITRAKQTIRDSGLPFRMPAPDDRAQRLASVLHVLYLVFNEGYASTSGPDLQRTELSAEAIRLTRIVHRLLPEDGEVAGLLALMLLTDARRPARTGPDGALIPMAEQDRGAGSPARSPRVWRSSRRCSPAATPARTSSRPPSPRCTTRRRAPEETDWPQIVALYELLLQLSDNPVVALNHAVAVAMGDGALAGPGAARRAGRGPAPGHRPPAARGPRAPAGDAPATPRPHALVPDGRRPHDQPPPAAVPGRPRGPPVLTHVLGWRTEPS